MEPQGLRSWVQLFCWHALQFVFQLLQFCSFLLLQIKSILSSPIRDIKLSKLPHHLAIVVDSEDAVMHSCKIVQLLRLLAQLGLQHVSLYDMKGFLKSSIVPLAEAFGDDSTVHFYYHEVVFPPRPCAGLPIKFIKYAPMNESIESFLTYQADGSFHDAKGVFPFNWRGQLMVEVLSLHDGKETIVQAVRHICLKALQSNALSNLKEEDIDSSLRETGGAGVDPDLLLLFSNTKCLLGFPAWRLRLTEIVHMGSIRNMTEKCLYTTLNEFSKKRHRYGK